MKKPTIMALSVGLLFASVLAFQASSNANAQYQNQPPQNQYQNQNNSNQQNTNNQPSQNPQANNQQNANVLNTTNTSQGTILVGQNGMTLYTFVNDPNGQSTCNSQCAKVWTPYTVNSDQPLNVDNNISGKVSTITRSDGSLQVTYNGMPLYFYSKDTKTGDVSGQGAAGLWFVAKP